MLTALNEPVTINSYTPSWIKSERYLYCDDFARDLIKSSHASIFALIRHLFQK